MTAFVILAAGRGGRAAQSGFLHKALLPLGGKAVISRQIELAPDSRVIIVTGYKAEQVKDYVELAHPHLPVTFIHVDDWDQPGSGPGKSLLAARSEVREDAMIFTSCDTLWEEDAEMWKFLTSLDSWAAVSVADSAGPGRWCRIGPEGVYDKSEPGEGSVYTGLAKILASDLPEFWKGIRDSALAEGECQVTGGLKNLFNRNRLETRRVKWTDTGTEASYERAVAGQGYNWAKPGEVTYVLPEEHRVVKLRESTAKLEIRRGQLHNAVPELTGVRPGMLAYKYTEGKTGYEAAEGDPDIVLRLLAWAKSTLWHPTFPFGTTDACLKFYRDKTAARITMLRPELQDRAWPLLTSVDYDELGNGCYPVTFHGDFNLGNIIVTYNREGGRDGFTAIDWREDFSGEVNWGDRRYDIGKLIAGLYVHWGRARQGDFRPWPQGMDHLAKVKKWLGDELPWDTMTIAALSLLSCAPLHAAPLDEILVNKAAEILEEHHATG